jgi:hypothetical protein
VRERLLGIHPAIAALGLLGLVAAAVLYPLGLGAPLPARSIDKSRSIEIASQVARDRGLDAESAFAYAITHTPRAERWDDLTRQFPDEEVLRAVDEGSLPFALWTVRLRHNLVDEAEDDDGGIVVALDGHGRLVSVAFGRDGSDEAPPREEARRVAREGLAAFGVDLEGFNEEKEPDADDTPANPDEGGLNVQTKGPGEQPPAESRRAEREQRFVWERPHPSLGNVNLVVNATVTAAGLTSFSREFALVGEAISPDEISTIVEWTVFVLTCVVLVISLLGIALSRLVVRDFVDRTRAAFVATLFCASLTLGFLLANDTSESAVLLWFLNWVLALSLGFVVFSAWLAGEADGYFAWGSRFAEAAIAATTFRLRARQVARETLEGFFWGWLMLGALAAAAAAVVALAGVDQVGRWPYLVALDTHVTPLFWAALLPWIVVFTVICLFFVPSWLHRVTRRAWVAIPLAAVVASLFATKLGLADVSFGNIPPSATWGLGFGIATCLIATRRGWLTSAVATLAFSAFYYGLATMSAAATPDRAWVALGIALLVAPPLAAFVFGPSLEDVVVRDAPPPRVSQMMEQARREEELDIARRVQSKLLPAEPPAFDAFDIAAVCKPATEVGGDYYDFFKLPDGRLGVAVGDVSGKGVPAAFSMTLAKGFMEVAAAEAREPDEALARANVHLRDHLTRNTFVTMAYAILDPESRTVSCARAGHNPPAHVRNGIARLVESSGAALGATPCERFSELVERRHLELEHGDTLVLYTDGVTEAMNERREELGETHLLAILSRAAGAESAHGVLTEILDAVDRHAAGAEQHDDITVVVIRAA